MSYIILKHVIWRFQMYNLFREILKFREDNSNSVFREILKCFHKTAKFNFFAKQIIYLASPDHPFDISRSLFRENAHKIAKSKYFPDILNDSDSPINSLSDDI